MLAPMASLHLQAESGYLFSSLESKNARTVGSSGKALFAGTLEWTFIDEEWAEFTAWWEATALGVDPFDLVFCTGAASLPHTVQALQPYSVVRDTGTRKVSLPVKLMERPTGLPSDWWWGLEGPPASYPTGLPMPQWGFKQEDAGLFLSTSGAATAARPVATRGQELSLSWTGMSGYQFDTLVDWWSTVLRTGRRKFTLSLPGFDDAFLCRLTADPSFVVDGANFSGSMDVVGAPYRPIPLPGHGYLYDTWETTVADRMADAFSDATADTLYDSAGA